MGNVPLGAADAADRTEVGGRTGGPHRGGARARDRTEVRGTAPRLIPTARDRTEVDPGRTAADRTEVYLPAASEPKRAD